MPQADGYCLLYEGTSCSTGTFLSLGTPLPQKRNPATATTTDTMRALHKGCNFLQQLQQPPPEPPERAFDQNNPNDPPVFDLPESKSRPPSLQDKPPPINIDSSLATMPSTMPSTLPSTMPSTVDGAGALQAVSSPLPIGNLAAQLSRSVKNVPIDIDGNQVNNAVNNAVNLAVNNAANIAVNMAVNMPPEPSRPRPTQVVLGLLFSIHQLGLLISIHQPGLLISMHQQLSQVVPGQFNRPGPTDLSALQLVHQRDESFHHLTSRPSTCQVDPHRAHSPQANRPGPTDLSALTTCPST